MKFMDHIQGTNCAEWECEDCGRHYAAPCVPLCYCQLPYTVAACWECAQLVGWKLADRIGGNVEEGACCELCGKTALLGEWRSGITAAGIRDDMR